MAVVLGTEVDSLFDCKQHGTCTLQSVERKVQQYRKLGLRHVFSVHLMNNGLEARPRAANSTIGVLRASPHPPQYRSFQELLSGTWYYALGPWRSLLWRAVRHFVDDEPCVRDGNSRSPRRRPQGGRTAGREGRGLFATGT